MLPPAAQVAGGRVPDLQAAVPALPLAVMVAPYHQVVQVERLAVEVRHAVTRAGVVTGRPPVLEPFTGGAENLAAAARHLACTAAQRGDFGVGEGAVPQRDVIHKAVEAGAYAVRRGGGADQ
ncbi:MAG: hypothetical protein OXH96_23355 [Spirochaetaceae bacterium]|nr:hypothetical protein [Spirochaetaceae bacterium]